MSLVVHDLRLLQEIVVIEPAKVDLIRWIYHINYALQLIA